MLAVRLTEHFWSHILEFISDSLFENLSFVEFYRVSEILESDAFEFFEGPNGVRADISMHDSLGVAVIDGLQDHLDDVSHFPFRIVFELGEFSRNDAPPVTTSVTTWYFYLSSKVSKSETTAGCSSFFKIESSFYNLLVSALLVMLFLMTCTCQCYWVVLLWQCLYSLPSKEFTISFPIM